LHFDAFHVRLNRGTVSEEEGDSSRGRVALLEGDGEEVQDLIRVAPIDAAHPDRENAFEVQSRETTPGWLARVRLPIETARDDGKAPLFAKVGKVAHADDRVLEVGRDDGEVFLVESDEAQQIHGADPVVSIEG
jgi:hypothetical protein